MKRFLTWAVLFIACCISTSAWAATVGRIDGTLTDAQTQEPLVGVTVSVVGTALGGFSDADGKYSIINVPAGTYTLRISSVGYETVEVEGLSVSADHSTYHSQTMTVTATDLGKVIKVTADAPMILRDKVASVNIVKAEELLQLPTRGFEDVVGIQTGVVAIPTSNGQIRGLRGGREATNGTELNIRGGRPSDVAYIVDGFSQQDPLSGTSTANISNNAIQEISVISGGFPVEYGHVSSGIVNVITKSGGETYSGTVEVVTDNAFADSYDQNWYTADLGGPIPGLENGYFFFSGERQYLNDRAPSGVTEDFTLDGGNRLPSNSRAGWTYQGKIDYNFTQNLKLQLGGTGSDVEWRQYIHSRYFDPSHMPYYHDQNLGLNAKITHTMSATTFYNLSASYFKTERFRGDGVHREDIWAYARPGGNGTSDRENLFWQMDDTSTVVVIETVWVYTDTIMVYDAFSDVYVPEASDSIQVEMITSGDESVVWDDFFRRKSEAYTFKGAITSELNGEHTVKAGFEFNRHTLRRYQHYFPVNLYKGVGFGGVQDANRYGYDEFGEESDDEGYANSTKNPIDFAIYASDRFDFGGLIITAGLRFDYYDYKALRLRNPELPLDPDGEGGNAAVNIDPSDLEESKAYNRVSPRLGVAFPISDKTQMRFSFGKFFQRPELQNLYVGYDFMGYKVRQGGYYVSFGNPNLEAPRTTAYEIGLTRQMGDYTALDFNAFYRDIADQVQVFSQSSDPTSFATFHNADYSTVKGLELGLKMRRNQRVALDIKYTLQYASGIGSYSTSQGNVAWTNSTVPKQTAPLDYDQRHKINGVFDLRWANNDGPKLGDMHPLENVGLNVLVSAGSGLPYTPVQSLNEATLGAFAPISADLRNSGSTDWTFRIDLKLEKKFNVGGYNITPYLWVKNLLDRDNVVHVWEASGKGNSTGWLETGAGQDFLTAWGGDADNTGVNGEDKYNIKQTHPLNYDIPRMMYVGLRASF